MTPQEMARRSHAKRIEKLGYEGYKKALKEASEKGVKVLKEKRSKTYPHMPLAHDSI